MTTIRDKFSPKQILSINDSNNKINIWQGAVSAGKSYASLWRWFGECRDGPEGPFVILTKTYDTFKRNVFPLLDAILGPNVKYYAGKREIYIRQRLVHVVGCSDERAEQKIRGPTFAGAYVDEITLIPESAFRMLQSRLRIPGAKLFGTTNPDSPFHWLKRDFLDGNPDVTSFHFLMDDNPYLTPDYKEYMKRQYKGLWYKRFIEGEWVQAEGSIYDWFNEKDYVLDFRPNEATYYICGIDYGTTNPCAFVLIGINRNVYPNVWIEDEFYYDSRISQRQKSDAEYADDLKEFLKYRNVQAIYIDPSAVSFKIELQREGFASIFEAKNDVNDGIRFVTSFFTTGTLKICQKCRNLIREMQSYVWDPRCLKTGEDKPLKQNDHSLDAMRYAIYTHFFAKPKDTPSSQDWDKYYRETRTIGPSLPAFFSDPIDPQSYRF